MNTTVAGSECTPTARVRRPKSSRLRKSWSPSVPSGFSDSATPVLQNETYFGECRYAPPRLPVPSRRRLRRVGAERPAPARQALRQSARRAGQSAGAEQPHFRRAPRASSSCSWKAARAISTCSTPSRCSIGWRASRCRASFGRVITPMGEFESPLLASRRTLAAAWPERAPGFPTGCRTSPSASTTSPSSAPAGPTASTIPPASAR